MISSIRKFKTKNRDLKITIMEMYQTEGFFSPALCRCHRDAMWTTTKYQVTLFFLSQCTTNTCFRDDVCLLCSASHPNQKIREKEEGGSATTCLSGGVNWSPCGCHIACVIPFWSHREGHCCFVNTWIQMYGFLQGFLKTLNASTQTVNMPGPASELKHTGIMKGKT